MTQNDSSAVKWFHFQLHWEPQWFFSLTLFQVNLLTIIFYVSFNLTPVDRCYIEVCIVNASHGLLTSQNTSHQKEEVVLKLFLLHHCFQCNHSLVNDKGQRTIFSLSRSIL